MAYRYQPHQLPRPLNYGYVSQDVTQPIVTMDPAPIRIDPERVERMTANMAPTLEMPDIVRFQWGGGDYNMVREAYKVMADQPTQLIGLTKDYVSRWLEQNGYPLNPSDWTQAQFEQKLAEKALDPNPLSLLGGF